PDAALPLGEDAALRGQDLAAREALLMEEAGDLLSDLNALLRVVGNTEADEHVSESHDAVADAADSVGEIANLGQREAIRVDHIVQKMHGQMDHGAKPLPVDLVPPIAARDVGADESPEVDGAEVAHVVRQQRLLAARVRRLVRAEM